MMFLSDLSTSLFTLKEDLKVKVRTEHPYRRMPEVFNPVLVHTEAIRINSDLPYL